MPREDAVTTTFVIVGVRLTDSGQKKKLLSARHTTAGQGGAPANISDLLNMMFPVGIVKAVVNIPEMGRCCIC